MVAPEQISLAKIGDTSTKTIILNNNFFIILNFYLLNLSTNVRVNKATLQIYVTDRQYII